MIEPTNRECTLLKRSHDFEQYYSSKRTKNDKQDDESSIDTDIESNYSISDNDSDIDNIENDSNLSTDQSRYIPIVYNQIQSLSRYSKKSIKQFRYIYEHNQRKPIVPTQSTDDNRNQNKSLRCEFKQTFNRIDLFKEGYTVLSDEAFPFYSLCYMCGSMGNDLIYCNSCCQAYHIACLNEFERPHLYPTSESWVCPNCTICNICGLSKNSSIISCSDCKQSYHIKCLKQNKDEEETLNRYQRIWCCPLCIKCDCGQALLSTERNLLSLNKSLLSQQSLMCSDCLNNMKIIRSNKNETIEKCHLCEKFIEQFSTKPKPLFSVSLIGNQSREKVKNLLQCQQCHHRFHPKCDGYLNEDVTLIPLMKNTPISIICSKCDNHQKENIRNTLLNYKIQIVKSTIASIISTLQIMITEDNRLHTMKRYMSNLQQLHQSRHYSLNLHAFINDLLMIIQRLLDNFDGRQWQAAIDNCIHQHCPWWKSLNRTVFSSSVNSSISRCFISPSIDHTYALNSDHLFSRSTMHKNHLLTSTDSLLRYIDNKLDEKDSFENLYQIDIRFCQLCQTYAEHYSTTISRLISIGINEWVHIGCILPAYSKILDQSPYILHKIREIVQRCQTKFKCDFCSKMGASVQCYETNCQTYYHCRCIEEYYTKYDQNLQRKFQMINGLLPNLTTLCVKHSKIKMKDETVYLDDFDLSKLKPVNLSSTIFADLSNTIHEFSLESIQLCIGSLQIKSFGDFHYLLDDDPNRTIYPNKYHASRLFWSTKNPREKTIYHLYIDIEQTYHQEKCNHQTIEYPLSNEEQLYEICQEYFKKFQRKPFQQKFNPLKQQERFIQENKQISSLIKCQPSKSISKMITRPRDRFMNGNSLDGKTLRSLFTDDPENFSRLALALVQAFQHPEQSLSEANIKVQEPIFSYYLSDQKSKSETNQTESPNDLLRSFQTQTSSIPQIDGSSDYDDHILSDTSTESFSSEELIKRYEQWSKTKYGHVKFTIVSNDGYRIVSNDLEQAWSNVVNLVRECRDDMKLTHLPMTNEELNGHRIFGLTKSIVKILLNQLYENTLSIEEKNKTLILPLSSSTDNRNSTSIIKRKLNSKKVSLLNSRLNIYQRKTVQHQRFNWLLNPNRKVEYALQSFEIDDALAYARQILLEESSVRLRLYHLRYFSERILIVGSSSIHGCGLFTLIDLIEGQMLIEYTGEIIRPCLTDKREYENERKGFGCYMFTVDSMNVIDATHQGNKARFINHNCQPNCFAKTIHSDGRKHIIIYALKDIPRGFELTYDYSFPEEDIKIPCRCGTNTCRIYLN